MSSEVKFSGSMDFRISAHKGLPAWEQQLIKRAIDAGVEPPESLRYNCRIAMDAREAFRKIELQDGETLSLHPKASPQFGKNKRGKVYLTATMVYSGDGKSYTFRWQDEAFPVEFVETAVKHDQGKRAKALTVALDFGSAEVTPTNKFHGYKAVRDHAAERKARTPNGDPTKKRRSRSCGRATQEDLNKRTKRAEVSETVENLLDFSDVRNRF